MWGVLLTSWRWRDRLGVKTDIRREGNHDHYAITGRLCGDRIGVAAITRTSTDLPGQRHSRHEACVAVTREVTRYPGTCGDGG